MVETQRSSSSSKCPLSFSSSSLPNSKQSKFCTHKVIYKRYAGLFFSLCVDITNNELAYLESIHLFVEILDHFFSNVCALDLVLNFHKGVSKGLVVEKIFTSMAEKEKQMDFVLCIGDDRSDEDMFELIGTADSRRILPYNTEVFACTVGQKWLVEIWVALEMVSSFVALATV